MRCTSFCEHGNDVASVLRSGRWAATGLASGSESAIRIAQQHGQRVQSIRYEAQRLFGDPGEDRSKTVFFPGCTSVCQKPEDALLSARAVAKLTEESIRVDAGECCGLPLLEAGDRTGFVAAARSFAARTGGADRVVFTDPGCMHAMRSLAPRNIRARARLVHLSELAAEQLESLVQLPGSETHRYHDACKLGRGLGIYDAPRRVLARITGREPAELPHERQYAVCSGAGGQLPRTDPETAQAIARAAGQLHEDAGGGTLVTACPGARSLLARSGTSTLDLSTLVALSVSSRS